MEFLVLERPVESHLLFLVALILLPKVGGMISLTGKTGEGAACRQLSPFEFSPGWACSDPHPQLLGAVSEDVGSTPGGLHQAGAFAQEG